MICFAAIAPHPPIIIPGIGKKEDLKKVQKTILAMESLRQDFEKSKPDAIIIISPHAPMEFGYFGINSAKTLAGDLSDFGLEMPFKFTNDLEIAQKIQKISGEQKIGARFFASPLDHGALVPLYYLTKNLKPKLAHLSFSGLDFLAHYRYGEIIGSICADSREKIAIIASGDLSHRLSLDAPAGYSPRGEEFDRKLIEFLENKKTEKILSFNSAFVEDAGECGLRSVIILLGALKAKECRFGLLSYEGPFGVGYMVGRMAFN